MPKPIVCLSAELSQYMDVFRPCFSKRQWKYFVIVLLGLIECDERRTLTGVLRTIGERVSLSGLSRFLNKWPWSVEEVAENWHQRFRQRMAVVVANEHARLRAMRPKRVGRPKATVVTGHLILDDSIHVKPKGRKMGGLGHHYANSEGRVTAGHCLFTGLYVLLGQRSPLPMQMYRQKAVCKQEDVPFRSKIDMAVEQIDAFKPVTGAQTHLLIDSWYHCKRVRKAAQQRGWHVSGGLKSNRVMRLIDSDGHREWLRLSDYLARLGPDDWQQITWPSQQGGRTLYAHLVPTWIRKLGPTLLLITRTSLDAPLKQARFWGSSFLDQDLQTLVDALAVRWEIEVFFEYAKDLLGSDHYQLMTAQAIIRFWTLIACLMAFLEEQRATEDDPLLTCGDIRRRIQAEHRFNLIQWLHTQFQSGTDPGQIYDQLALSSS
jgi:SRSO17 transposase